MEILSPIVSLPGPASRCYGEELRKSLLVAAACAAAVFLWQALAVHFLYAGDWTGLFCVGSQFPQPAVLGKTWVFAGSAGYDGQFYRMIAHDPWHSRGFAALIDDPRLRYGRILIPLLAHILGAGQDRFIDGAYVAVVLLFVFLGTFWLARYSADRGLSPWWGAAFVLVPATLVSIDRLTVDIALASLCAGFIWYRERGAGWPLYVLLLVATLARDTGLVLLASWVAVLVWERRFARAAVFATAAIPALAWLRFVATRTPPDPTQWLSPWPFSAFLHRLLHPIAYPLPPAVAFVTTVFDYVALAGMALAIVLALRLVRRENPASIVLPVLAFVPLVALVNKPDIWSDAYSFGRAYSPLLLLLAAVGIARRRWIEGLPLLLTAMRLLLQLAAEAQRIVIRL